MIGASGPSISTTPLSTPRPQSAAITCSTVETSDARFVAEHGGEFGRGHGARRWRAIRARARRRARCARKRCRCWRRPGCSVRVQADRNGRRRPDPGALAQSRLMARFHAFRLAHAFGILEASRTRRPNPTNPREPCFRHDFRDVRWRKIDECPTPPKQQPHLTRILTVPVPWTANSRFLTDCYRLPPVAINYCRDPQPEDTGDRAAQEPPVRSLSRSYRKVATQLACRRRNAGISR